MNVQLSSTCPLQASRDDRKSARIAAERIVPEPGTRVTRGFAAAREILRSDKMRQGLGGGERFKPTPPVIFLDGEAHRRSRSAIARFFTPKAIMTRYRAVMEEVTDRLLADMRTKGDGRLDEISFELAVVVAGDMLGLPTKKPRGLASHIESTLSSGTARASNWVAKLLRVIQRTYCALRFFYLDVRPAIAARRRQRGDDVISHLIDEGYSNQAILIECMTYAAAGMVTTREFITMAAWHMFENEALRERFVTGDDDDQFAILEEILRLEPVAGTILRRTAEESDSQELGHIPADAFLAIDVRAVNTDESVTGPCPFTIDPDRGKRMKGGGSLMSFGDGNHRCPGAQLALHEARVFLERFFKTPGLRLEREPEVHWDDELMTYELRNAIVTCDRA